MATHNDNELWILQGLAQFIDILTADYSDSNRLYNKIISSLVRYMGGIQGSLLSLEYDQHSQKAYLSYLAGYAVDRKRLKHTHFSLDDGLLGQVYRQREIRHIKNIPPGYIMLQSVVGEHLPRELLIVPLISKDKLIGMIELIFFTFLKPYQLNFVDKLSRNIAAILSGIKAGERTKWLLAESQHIAKQLEAAQDGMKNKQRDLEKALIDTEKAKEELREQKEAIEVIKEREANRAKEIIDKQKSLISKRMKEMKASQENLKEKNEQLEAQERTMKSYFLRLQNTQRELEQTLENEKTAKLNLLQQVEEVEKARKQLELKNEEMQAQEAVLRSFLAEYQENQQKLTEQIERDKQNTALLNKQKEVMLKYTKAIKQKEKEFEEKVAEKEAIIKQLKIELKQYKK